MGNIATSQSILRVGEEGEVEMVMDGFGWEEDGEEEERYPLPVCRISILSSIKSGRISCDSWSTRFEESGKTLQ